ncbi:TetR/AcrR family transcriptional regulator C-terminal domain-containing protein [Paraburkholderia nemoris]|uniref:TetR/AcrR family transcriptional regulator n=1 Tax=Paraburkholderia nemoris TaxID=2793076 RepID=UPI001EEFD7DF|nr:TetR/AcrR family transcriptional regulator C-terminal domain-containing protein [Paraburkholderia nemoris]
MQTETTPRRRGRPPRVESPIGAEPLLSRNVLIDRAAEMAKRMSLDQISMVQLAKEFGVAPGLIHYYLGSRDDLISGVLNKYYRERVERLAPLTGDWRTDVEGISNVTFSLATEWPGISLYVVSHNRFRLFQEVPAGETDYGMVLFDHIVSAFLQGGFTTDSAALAYHLLAQFLLASSVAVAGRQAPAEHKGFILDKFASVSRERYPAATAVGPAFASLDSDKAFQEGLRLLLDGFEQWANANAPKAASARPASKKKAK